MHDITFDIFPGEKVAIVGPNGAGKTTTIECALGTKQADTGTVSILGMNPLKDRKKHLKGRCSSCRWLYICNGNFRARAEAAGGFWHSDPACYLTDEEIK